MTKSTVLRLIPAIGAFREMMAKKSDEKIPGTIRDHTVSKKQDLEHFDFVETK